MDIKKDSHPYYALWRVLEEWCNENEVGRCGEVSLQDAIDMYEKGKRKSTVQRVSLSKKKSALVAREKNYEMRQPEMTGQPLREKIIKERKSRARKMVSLDSSESIASMRNKDDVD